MPSRRSAEEAFARRSTCVVARLAARVALFGTAGAVAQASRTRSTDLTVTQGDGYATLALDDRPGRRPTTRSSARRSTRRTCPRARPSSSASGSPQRQVNNAFADVRGRRLRARRPLPVARPRPDRDDGAAVLRPGVRDDAIRSGARGPGADLRTQWESSGNATYTSDVNEYAYEAAVDAASDRVRVVEIGRTNPIATGAGAPGNRPINMFIIHYPIGPGHRGRDLEHADGRGQLQRPRRRAAGPRGLSDRGARARVHDRPAPDRAALEHGRADHADDQPERPRPQHARQRDRRRPEPRPRRAAPAGDEGVRGDAPRLHARGRHGPPRGRQRGPADPLGPAPERRTSRCSSRARTA